MATKSPQPHATQEPTGNAHPVPEATQQSAKKRRQLTPEQKAERQAMLKGESKADKFRRLANRRMQCALLVLTHVRNLTNSNQYEYTPEQATKIVNALLTSVGLIRAGFEGAAKEKGSFSV